MSRVPLLSLALLGGGGATTLAALAWWGLTFGPPVGNAYLSVGEAGRCLLADSSLCRLATTLCGARHLALVAAYSPIAFWTGLAAACGGLCAAPSRRAA